MKRKTIATARELRKILKVSSATLTLMMRDGLPHYRTLGGSRRKGHFRFDLTEVFEWLEATRQHPNKGS